MSSYAARNYSSESQQIGSSNFTAWGGASSEPCAEPGLVCSACAWASEPAVEPALSVELGAAPGRVVDRAPLEDRVQSVDQVPSAGQVLWEGQARMEVS